VHNGGNITLSGQLFMHETCSITVGASVSAGTIILDGSSYISCPSISNTSSITIRSLSELACPGTVNCTGGLEVTYGSVANGDGSGSWEIGSLNEGSNCCVNVQALKVNGGIDVRESKLICNGSLECSTLSAVKTSLVYSPTITVSGTSFTITESSFYGSLTASSATVILYSASMASGSITCAALDCRASVLGDDVTTINSPRTFIERSFIRLGSSSLGHSRIQGGSVLQVHRLSNLSFTGIVCGSQLSFGDTCTINSSPVSQALFSAVDNGVSYANIKFTIGSSITEWDGGIPA
jgi:hypothetical protein